MLNTILIIINSYYLNHLTLNETQLMREAERESNAVNLLKRFKKQRFFERPELRRRSAGTGS